MILGDLSWGERHFSTDELVFVKMHDDTTKVTILWKENSIVEANNSIFKTSNMIITFYIDKTMLQ